MYIDNNTQGKPEASSVPCNERLLPSLNMKKKTISIQQAQWWLWQLGY